MKLDFEWDEAKNNSNFLKHGVGFEDVVEMINSGNVVIKQSPNKGNDSSRHMAIGKIGDKFYTAIFTYRSKTFRIISARRSRKIEKSIYEQR